jgi:hypothetical protein
MPVILNPQSFTDKTTQFLLSDKSLAVIDQKQELSFSNSSTGCVVAWDKQNLSACFTALR